MMKKLVLVFIGCLLVAGVANAAITKLFLCDGSGDMVGDVGAVVYGGGIPIGDLAPGTWSIALNDSGWPTEAGARWDHIWNTFYEPNYSSGDPSVWTATFDTPLLPTRPVLYLEHSGVGSMSGIADMRFQVIDWDNDREVDPDECDGGELSGMVIIIEDGTGDYSDLCGTGSYQGDYIRDCDTHADAVTFWMDLLLDECGMATEPASWGAIKALYQ